MAEITYQVIQKPIEERLLDAACIYWDVSRKYFVKNTQKNEEKVVYRRRVLFYLIKMNTTYSHKTIGKTFEVSTTQVYEGVETIGAQKDIYRQICEDINQISFLADKLDAEFITNDIKLNNKNPV